MISARVLTFSAVVAASASIVSLVCGRAALPQASAQSKLLQVRESSSAPALAGSSSCAAAGCHGALRSQPGELVQHNELTLWVGEDRHALAYDALFSSTAVKMVKLLGGKGPAHEDIRCLACHVNPLTATTSPSTRQRAEWTSGTGCEACHGSASQWLPEHTQPAWRLLGAAEKRKAGMTPPGDTAAFARQCAGCHVGAPEHDGMPLRDVNHDLIAAGHPRLHFEFGVYLANLPRHWSKKIDEKRPPDYPLRAWFAGQLVSAQAAAELLADRAQHAGKAQNGRPWPEFAEYNCYACHHDLSQPSERQKLQHFAGRTPGSLPWGSWHFSMPGMLAENDDTAKMKLLPILQQLRKLMQERSAGVREISTQASAAASGLRIWLDQSQQKIDSAALATQLRASTAWGQSFLEDWDQAEQLYLGLAALQQWKRDPSAGRTLEALARKLAFDAAPDKDQYESPRDFDRNRSVLRQQFQELGKNAAQ
jgi:Cytochrome c554 and c-prime